MSDPPSYDNDLLNRLNALKKSSIQLDSVNSHSASSSKTTPNPENDLSARLRSLRNGSASPSPSPVSKSAQPINPNVEPAFPATPSDDPDPLLNPIDIDDKTLDELLADLGPEDQWTLNPDDPDDIQKLLNEAKAAFPKDDIPGAVGKVEPQQDGEEERGNRLTSGLDMSVFALDDDGESREGEKGKGKDGLEDDAREAQYIVARMLDEINLERANEAQPDEDKSEQGEEVEVEKGKKAAHADDVPSLSLPSAPSKLPDLPTDTEQDSKKSLDFESDIAARMAALSGLGSTNALGLPSAPTFKPADKPVKGLMKKYTDEEVDSWCIICQDDATVQCMGCGGDLYCAMCWKEGHMGPDVGWEEKRHKWSKYRKPN